MTKKHFVFIYQYLKKYKWIWTVGILFAVLSTVIKICYSWLLKSLVDEALIPKNQALLFQLCLFFGFLAVTASLFGFIKEYCFNHISQKSIFQMRKDLFSHIIKLPYRFFTKNDDGDIINKVINDTENTQQAFSDYIVTFISSAITVISVLVWLFYIDIKLTLIILIIVPVFIATSVLLWNKVGKFSNQDEIKRSEITSVLQESIASIELVKLLGKPKIFQKKFTKACEEMADNSVRLKMSFVFANSAWESILMPYQAIIFAVGGFWYITSDKPTVGTIMAFLNYLNLLIPAFLSLIDSISQMANGAVSIDRLQEYLSVEQEKCGTKLLSSEDHIEIEFRAVSFHHPESDFSIKNISFIIHNRDFVAIVGQTGSGKSTVIKLLARIYDVDSGQILINGTDIKEYEINDLRASLGFVQQDVHILKGSIKDNMLLADPDADMAQIEKALKMAQLNGLIMSLPQKYDTMISERGVTLSGGEKQRLSIARALLKQNKIMIMDEPTSSLDLETEKLILQDMKEIFSNITTLAIDHRMATVGSANKIIVMDNGEIVEEGSYEELRKGNGKFKKLIKNADA